MTPNQLILKPRITYNVEKIISAIYYFIDRFGGLYGFVILSESGEYLTLASDTDIETIWMLLSKAKGDVIYPQMVIAHPNAPNLEIRIQLDIEETVEPTCIYCGSPLSVSLGSVVCTNTECNGRNRSRTAWFLKSYDVLKSDADIARLLDSSFNRDHLSISGIVGELMEMKQGDIIKNDIKELFSDISIALGSISENASLELVLEFVDRLSLPNVTATDVTNIIDQDDPSIISDLFSYIAYSFYTKDPWMNMELLGIQDLVNVCCVNDDTYNDEEPDVDIEHLINYPR